MRQPFYKTFRYCVEYILALPFLMLIRYLPWRVSQRMMRGILGCVAPYCSGHRRAKKNLHMIFPHWSSKKIQHTLQKMWTHWADVLSGYPHIARVTPKVEGQEFLRPAAIYCGAHLSHFQWVTQALKQHNIQVDQVSRLANNPWIAKVMLNMQYGAGVHNVLIKGKTTMMALSRSLRRGHAVYMLVDQKMKGGVQLPFLGRKAWVNRAPVVLARRWKVPLIPVGVQGDTVVFHPPIVVDEESKEIVALQTLNTHIEQWIHAYPWTWFWPHNRWDI